MVEAKLVVRRKRSAEGQAADIHFIAKRLCLLVGKTEANGYLAMLSSTTRR